MTTADLRLTTRRWLADTGRGHSSTQPFWSDQEIDRSNDSARSACLRTLLRGNPDATITCCRMVKTVSGLSGDNTPADYLVLECGIRDGASGYDPNGYIPSIEIPVGVGMTGLGRDGIWSVGGKFYGNAKTAVYWKNPTSDLTASSATLTDFPDCFYQAVAVFSAADLSEKHPKRKSMQQPLSKIWKEMIATLR